MSICPDSLIPKTPKLYLFQNTARYWYYIYMLFITVIYLVPIYALFKRRKTPEMQPRSPYLTLLGLVYLMVDSLGNTYLFAIDPTKKQEHVCYLGVLLTVTCQCGFLAMVVIRMYRIYSVYSAYEEYLKLQKKSILDE